MITTEPATNPPSTTINANGRIRKSENWKSRYQSNLSVLMAIGTVIAVTTTYPNGMEAASGSPTAKYNTPHSVAPMPTVTDDSSSTWRSTAASDAGSRSASARRIAAHVRRSSD